MKHLDELESAAVVLIGERQLRLRRQAACAGILIDLLIEGQNAKGGLSSLALQIRPWNERDWPQVISYATREAELLEKLEVAVQAQFLVPGRGLAPSPLATLSTLEEMLSTWSSPTAAQLREADWDGSLAKQIAFCAMPFHEDFLDVYWLGILPSAKGLGVDLNRLDQTYSFTGITQRIWHGIDTADFIIADISGHNPNVMYEVGLAHGMGRKTFLIRDSSTEIPFDVKDSMVLTYDRRKLHRLQQDLADFLRQALT